MLNSFVESSLEVALPSILLIPVIEVLFRLTSWSLGGPGSTESASCICLQWMHGAGGNQDGAWGGHWSLFNWGKKMSRGTELPLWRQVYGSSPLCRHHEMYFDWGQNWPSCFASLVKNEDIKDCPLAGMMFLSAQVIFCCKWFCRSCKG